jgi:hypothetical protein
MLRGVALIMVAAALVTGCAGQPQPTAATPASMPLVACDDGGSGGVMIDGVCL